MRVNFFVLCACELHACLNQTFAGELNDLWTYANGIWTWIAGSSGFNDPGSFGTWGVGTASTYPCARNGASGGVLSSGSVIVFGGQETVYGELLRVGCGAVCDYVSLYASVWLQSCMSDK